MMFTSLFLAVVIYCCQNTSWALKTNEDAASAHRSKYDLVQNMVDCSINRNSDNNKACSPCNPNTSGMKFTHTSDCKKFIWCVHGKPQDGSCAPGTHFNNQTKDCGHTRSTPCVTAQYTNPDGSCNPSGISEPPTNPNNNKACSPCNPNTSGMKFTHTSDCKKFIWCVHGKPQNGSCAPGTHFNNQTKDCDHTWSTPCVTAQYTNSDGSCNPSGISEPPTNPKCGVVKQVNRIVGGQKSAAHEYPWMATIMHHRYPQTNWCGGSLISSRWILTAAHCFYKKVYGVELTIDETMALLGHHNLHTATVKYFPKRLLRHKFYSLTGGQYPWGNDIALLELESPVEFSEMIYPVCLPTTDKPYLDTSVTVIGYGITENGFPPLELMEVKLSTISNSKCRRSPNSRYNGLPPSMLCAWHAKGGKDSCSGDSGGPLMNLEENLINEPQYVQIGVVSNGPHNCGTKGEPGVYTRVSKYLKWIGSNTNGELMDAIPYDRK